MSVDLHETFYEASAVARPVRARLVQDIDTGVCIVGGGFAGLWIARALARRGYDVAVLEGGTVAGQASGRNGGFVSAGYAERLARIVERVGLNHAKSLYALSRQGMDVIGDMLAEGTPGLEPVPGRLNVRRYDDEVGARREADHLGEHFGHEMVVWPTERVRETLKTERYYQALHDADAFAIHPLNLALALAAEIERHGGRIFEQTVATGADLEGVRKWVTTQSGRVRAQDVVFCGSAFIGDGFPALARTILPVSTYVGVTKPIPEQLKEAIGYGGGIADTRRAGDYYRVVGDRLLWGGRISTRTRTPRRLGRRLARDIGRVYPSLKGVEMEYAWSGIMGYAIHRMPQIGMLRPGAWVASGFGGHGLNTTAMAGELISTAIVDNDERWRQFIPFGLVWAGGGIGRRTSQAVYWGMQIRDKVDETYAHVKERRAKRLAAAEGQRKLAEETAAKEEAKSRRKREADDLQKLLAREEELERKREEAEGQAAERDMAREVEAQTPMPPASGASIAAEPKAEAALAEAVEDIIGKKPKKKSRRKDEAAGA